MAEDIKKVPEELKDEEIDLVAGGAYTQEQWDKMTLEEKRAAQQRSLLNKFVYKTTCEMD